MSSVATAEDQTQAAYTGAIRALATALDARDPYTAGHSERVSVLSVAIGRSLRLRDDEIEVIRLGALLHDIGKIGVPDAVLLKPTRADARRVRHHQAASRRGRAHPPVGAVSRSRTSRSSSCITSGPTDADIRTACAATRFRLPHTSCTWPTRTTPSRAPAPIAARGPRAKRCTSCGVLPAPEFHAEAVGALATVLPGVISETGEILVESVHA